MTPFSASDLRFSEMSRELALACDRSGTIVWADDRARRLLGSCEGRKLSSLAVAGTGDAEDLFGALLARVRDEKAAAGDASMMVEWMVNGRAQPVTLSVAEEGDHLLLLASLAAEDVVTARRATERLAADLRRQKEALSAASRELEESNRGVIALYSELDEKADSLRRTSEVKSRVVSNVSHEFRTPLNSILGLTRLLLSHVDGTLNPEQEKQLGFILRSATELSELVNDLLDLSKMESGKIRLHATRFDAADLFAALRGMSRPLLSRTAVQLVFDDPEGLPTLETDEGKVSQVLRNLVSNALKFTERGEVRVSAKRDGDRIVWTVADTGVGIAEENLEKVFEEFTQIENPLQRFTKGTGLGLSLSRKLAELLGGSLTAEGKLGEGAKFSLSIPIVHPEVQSMQSLTQRASDLDPGRAPVLVVEDDRQTLFLYEKYLAGAGFQVMPARSIDDARAILLKQRPAAIVLDIMLEGETSWRFLSDLKSSAATRDIPVLVVTVTDRENKARALGADEFWMKPMDEEWLLRKLKALARRGPVEKVLVIDDDDVARYLVKRLLAETPYRVLEASGGLEGIRMAREELPSVILLDFVMPGLSAFEVLDELKANPLTRNIPVIIHTSKVLQDEERRRLSVETAAILNKQSLSREVAIGRIREALQKAGVGGAVPASDVEPSHG